MTTIFRKFTATLTFLLLVLLASCMAMTWLLLQEEIAKSILCGMVLLAAIIGMYRLYRRNALKVTYMFDAIDNDDYSLKFSVDSLTPSDELVNISLNRIKDLLFRAKAEAAEKEKYYELIMDSVTTGIIVINDKGNIYQSNNEALRLLGLSVFTHVSQLRQLDETLAGLIGGIQPGNKRHVSFVNERGTVNLSIRASGLTIRQDRLRLIAINDINSELDEKEIDSRIRLTRVLTHEIMNSITPITSMSDTLLELHTDASPEIRSGLEVISSTGKGLISFVESYRKFTRIPTPQPGLFYLDKFVSRMVELTRHHYGSSPVSFDIDIQPNDLIIYADENLIGQVFINLLKNAVQSIGSQPDGLIRIKARCNSDEEIIIEVSNNGPPIPPEIGEHIFIPFFTTKEGGSGIGLSLSRQIMRLSGGSITLKTSTADKMTTFILIFK